MSSPQPFSVPYKTPSPREFLLFALLALGAGVVTGVAVSFGPLAAAAVGMAVLAAAMGTMSLSSPWIGLVALTFITYLRLSDVLVHYHRMPSIAKPLVALLLGLVIARWVLYSDEPRGWALPVALVGAYTLVILLSLFFAANFNTAVGAASDFIKDGIITVLVVMLLQHTENFYRVVWALLFVGIFLGTLSVYQYLTGDFGNNFWGFAQAPVLNIVGESNQPRLAGPIGDPNFYAQIMVTLVPLALNRVFAERRFWWRLLAFWALTATTLTVIFTFSRGSFLALMVSLAVMTAYYRPSPSRMMVVGVAVALLLPFIPADYAARLSTLTDFLPGQGDVRNEVSFRGRSSEWIVAGMMFMDYPLLGVGIRNYPEHYLDYSSRLGLDPRRENREPHSFYLEIAAESGIAGILVFLTIFYSLFRSIRTAWRRYMQAGAKAHADIAASFGFALVGYLTAAIFIHAAFPRYFWLLTGIGLSLLQTSEHFLEQQRADTP